MKLTKTLNLNDEVVIYPNEMGFDKISQITKLAYNLDDNRTKLWIESRITNDGGFKEQLWVICSVYHDIFFNGSPYLKNTTISLNYLHN